jgi:aldehyde dehydrogenase (NAD+)
MFCSNTLCWVALVAFAIWWMRVVHFFRCYYERMTAPVAVSELPKAKLDAPPAAETLSPKSAGAGKIQCYNKATNASLGVVDAMSKPQLEVIMNKAREAQKKWAQTPFSVRRQLLYSVMNYVIEHQETLCRTGAMEGGKTMVDGTLGEVLTTLEKIQWTCKYGEDVLAAESREVGLVAFHKRAVVSYRPFGVITAIVSWNYPFHNIIGPMISALFAGNAFVGKVSEYTSYYTKFYEGIVRSALKQLGQSEDLVCFVNGFADAGEALVGLADKVTFIGSPQVGKLVMKKASETLTPVVLELGGKDPAVICDDADIDQLVPIVMRGTFQNCGQNCVGLERVVAHYRVYDKLVTIFERKVKELTQGATSDSQIRDCGAMTMGELACAKIQRLVDDAVKKGAKALVGGNKQGDKPFYPPTLLVDVTTEMDLANEEVFGPVLVIMKFQNDDEAADIINSCPYGLGCSVFSADKARAQALGKKLHTGMLNINDFGINYLCQSMPFGGCKVSGFDRFAGIEGLRGNCIVHSSTVDRFPGAATHVPPPMQYPLSPNSFKFTQLLVRVLYGNVTQMIGAIMGFISYKK